MTLTVPILFWLSAIGLAYIYAGYPLMMWALSRLFSRSVKKEQQPRKVSVVIVAYNEAARLPQKLANLLSLDHAEWIAEILVGSDGSTDGTVRVVSEFPDPRIKVITYAQRRGKPSVLNELIPQCRGEIVMLSDCRQEFDSLVLTKLAENFADPTVGVVSGELVFRSDAGQTTAARGIGLYWMYEKFIRKCESRFRCVPGATGACYAIRQSLFRPIKEQIILDDVAIPMQIIALGYRCLFEPGAIAFDDPSQDANQESIRKRRTIAGVAQLVREYPQWLWPWRNPIWLEYVSHKVLRLISPMLLVVMLAANVMLLELTAYRISLGLQGLLYGSALAGWMCQLTGRRSQVFGPSLMFVALNITTALALWDALRSKYRVTWQKTQDWNPEMTPRNHSAPVVSGRA